jgi:hypothetical protein
MNTITFHDTDAAARRIQRERQLIAQGIDPFAARAVAAQDFAPPLGGERKFEISIRDVSTTPPPPPGVQPSQPPTQAPRWTQPSEPSPPSGFAAEVVNVIASRLGHRLYKRQSVPKVDEPEPDPDTFAGQLALAIKRRRRGYAPPKPWSQSA